MLVLLMSLLPAEVLPQQTAIHQEPDATYRQAMELFDKEKFGAARELFLQTIRQITESDSEMLGSATLYAAICAAELFNPDAGELLLAFLNNHPTHPGQRKAWFQMGNIHYRQREYREAGGWYARLSPFDLPADSRDEFLFKKGYSHFMTESYPEASRMFTQITDTSSGYYAPARYYHGHVAYLTGDYDMAMQAFQRLVDDRNFGPVVPYYIVHIYFLQQRYEDLLRLAPVLLEEATPRRAPEISRLIGEAHFHRGDYQEAIPYLEAYVSQPGSGAGRQDHYQLGFAYFITGSFEQAIRHLERVTPGEDYLAQNAYYHLGYCYIQTGQKRFARNAFMQSHQMPHLEEISRESLFHYAKLSFELSYDPYNEAILAFQKYIDLYPDSPRTEEAYAHLIDLYLSTSNYKEALASLEKIPIDNPRLREAYQRVSYYRGVELFNNGDFEGAIAHFSKTQRYRENNRLTAASLFWMGESHYRMGNYENAIAAYDQFMLSPGAFSLDFYNRASYSLGYAHFKKENYNRAIPAFRNYITAREEEPRMLNDATLRIADSYFITKDYRAAMDFYNRAIGIGAIDSDYAVFQKGLVYGIMGDFTQKIATLQELINNHPRSSFIDDGRYEIANSWLILDNSTRAMEYFRQVIDRHPNSSYVQSAMLKTGLIHYNLNQDEQALNMFKAVVNDYPGTPQAREALASIRTIYVGLDRVDEFLRFSEGIGMADISAAQQDSLTYQAAENRYMQGDCSSAVQSFGNYLERFPSGIFSVNAMFYRSECYFRTNQQERALAGYEAVISRPRTKFHENALLRASGIHYQLGNFENANTYYNQLEQVAEYRNNILTAREGQMRSLYRLGRHQETMLATEKLMTTDKVSPELEQEAFLIRGISAMAIDNRSEARESLKNALGIADNRRAAEAMYNLALISFREGDYDQAEQEVFEYIGRMSAYDDWLARTFLLLADVYMAMDNHFQAKHTLESIIEHYDGEDIREQARQRLDFIHKQESLMEQSPQPEPIEVELGNEPQD